MGNDNTVMASGLKIAKLFLDSELDYKKKRTTKQNSLAAHLTKTHDLLSDSTEVVTAWYSQQSGERE